MHHDVFMRTTLTLDADVVRLLEQAVHDRRTSMKSVVNDALRQALRPAQAPRPYRVDVHHSELVVGVDPARLNQLADELEDETIVDKRHR